MKRTASLFVLSVVLTLLIGVPLCGQEIGATAETVEATAGKPSMVRRTSEREVWMYADGRRVTFQNGIVTGVEGPGMEGISLPGAARQPVATGELAASVRASEPEPGPEVVQTPVTAPDQTVVATTSTEEGTTEEFLEEEEIGLLPAMVGLVVVLVWVVASIWFLILAFKEGFWWGMGCLCLPVVPLIFAHRNWGEVKKPFCLSAVASGLLIGINALF